MVKGRSRCTGEERSGLFMVVFDLSSSRGVAGLSPSRRTAHKALCCVLEQDIVSSALIVLVQLEKRPDRVVKMLTGT